MKSVAVVIAFSIAGSEHLAAQQKTFKKQAVGAPATPVDEVVNTLFATHRFEQTAISPDGKKIAWVETLVGKDGAPDGNTAIYVEPFDAQRGARMASFISLLAFLQESRSPW